MSATETVNVIDREAVEQKPQMPLLPSEHEVLERLVESVDSGKPFDSSLNPFFTYARSGQVKYVLNHEATDLRNMLYNPDGETLEKCEGKVPRLDDYMRARTIPNYANGINPDLDLKPSELVNLLYKQFRYFTSNLNTTATRRCEHIYQVQMQPSSIRAKMRHLVGFTFVPGRRLNNFKLGERLVELSHPKAVSLNIRNHKWPNGFLGDMVDIRVHDLSIDRETGQCYVGGIYHDGDGLPVSRTTLARYFGCTPSDGKENRLLPASNTAVVDSGMALHKAMEKVAVSFSTIPCDPTLPDIFLGFQTKEDVRFEDSLQLRQKAVIEVNRYINQLIAVPSTLIPSLNKFEADLTSGGRRFRDWEQINNKLGDDASNKLLREFWNNSYTEYDGVYLFPLALFSAFSQQQPVRCATRVFAHFPEYLMGREIQDDDGMAVDETLARPQVVKSLYGNSGPFEYDLLSVPVGWDCFFEEAPRVRVSDTYNQYQRA